MFPSGVLNTDVTGVEERHRERVVQLILIVYYLLIFEGVLRKWVLPHWGRALFFLRDPFVLAIYFLVVSRRTRLRYGLLEAGCLFGIGAILLALLQRLWTSGDGLPLPFILQAYGWRNYFFYLPLAFVMGRYLTLPDLERLSRVTMRVSVAMAALALVQFASPHMAPINAGLGDSPEELYRNQGLPGGYVRPFGTFTSSVGMTAFTVSALALSVPLWLVRPTRQSSKRWLDLTCAVVGPFSCLALSGSRGALVGGALVVLLGATGLMLAPGVVGLKAISIIATVSISAILTAPLIFPQAVAAFAERWADAGEHEQQEYGFGGIVGRAIDEVFRFRVLFDKTPPEGFGLGSAGNAAWNLGVRSQVIAFTTEEEYGAAETDWGRNVLELGPLFGTTFIFYRIALTLWLAKQCLSATIRSGHPLPWFLFTYALLTLLNGQITANGTLNGYGWVFSGFCLAAVYSVKRVKFGAHT